MTDWTDHFDQNNVACKADKIVDEIIIKIYQSKFAIHSNHNLSIFEVALLHRWPIYIGVNKFIERLLRITAMYRNRDAYDFPLTKPVDNYFKNTVQSVQSYYYDFSINYKILNDLSEIISGPRNGKNTDNIDLPRPQESLVQKMNAGIGLKNILRHIFISVEKIYVRIFKPKIIGESSGWFRKLFFFGHCIDFYAHDFADQNKKIDVAAREKFKRIFSNVFIDSVPGILKTLDGQQVRQCANVFAEWIDRILPLSLVEGLHDRFDYYQTMLKDWPVEQVHAFTGYYYNDNFKVFAILAKRRGAKFVGHTHGANNYVSLSFKGANELRFLDYYTTYGIIVSDNDLENPGANQVNFIPTGSTAFMAVPKWRKSSISISKISLLYPSGPLMGFMSYLQEISPEKILDHRLRVLDLLNQLLYKYDGLKVYYKSFPGSYTNDPIKEHCSSHIDGGRIELIDKKPMSLYNRVDLVLWNTISTGFGECVAASVPVIVFNSRHEYEQSSPRGRLVNDALTEAGVQCFNADSAINSFERIVHHLDKYKKETEPSIKMFKDNMATPVSRREWHRRFSQGISSAKDIA